MSWACVSPETAQKTCTLVAQITHPANRLHVDNRFVDFEYSPLPFRAKCNEGPKSMRVVYNFCPQSDPWVLDPGSSLG